MSIRDNSGTVAVRSVEMVSSITQDPYSIIISRLASSANLNIGTPPRPTELRQNPVMREKHS